MKSMPIYVEAPARLHLGFLDLNGGLGRRFGSVGLTLDGLATKIIARPSDQFNVIGDPSGRVQKYAEKFIAYKGLSNSLELEVVEQILGHSGLGSGTQLAIAVGTALSKLFEIESKSSEIAVLSNRGARSGIGIGAFDRGGFLVDAGRNSGSKVPPIISRLEFPSNWRVILIFDKSQRGLHGQDEDASFARLPDFSPQTAEKLCRLVLMQILPAVSEQNIDIFNLGIYELQKCIGEYFASAQGGRYTSPVVAEACSFLESLGVKGVGQSSWGPTGFAFVDSETNAHLMLRKLQSKFASVEDLNFKIVSGRNAGAIVKDLEEKDLEKQEITSLSKSNKS
ncbi:MAG: beta-ribofuranosylaminobenzene 5'-phosphate synthase family protein [Gammaproteobacteria bacterium]